MNYRIHVDEARVWFIELSAVFARESAWLTELDRVIGDADHGINMERGFRAVAKALQDPETEATNDFKAAPADDLGALFQEVAMQLLQHVGGASGPLYGSFFLKAAASLKGRQAVDSKAFFEAIWAGTQGLALRGKAQAGDKTMLDAWLAVCEAAKGSHELSDLAQAAEAGARATRPMLAKKGRASYLKARSIGHQDPGASSSWLLLKTLADVHARSDASRGDA